MSNQFQTQSLAFGKQIAEQAYNAQIAALKGASEIQNLQLKALESQTKSNFAFLTDSLEAREAQDVTGLWPKGLDFARESAEAAYSTSQEILGVAQKTAERLGELTRDGLEAANGAGAASAKKAR